MSISVALHHVTHYSYDREVAIGPQVIRLRPAPHCRTKVPSYSLKVSPAEHFVNWQQDPHGNWLARFVFPEKADHLRIEVDLTAEMAVINPFDFFVEEYAEHWPFDYTAELKNELLPYLELEDGGPLLEAYVAALPRDKAKIVPKLVDLNARLQREISYVVRMEAGVQTPDETLKLRSGSCRDSAWLLVQILRRLGLAARFVSGYLLQLKADVDPLEGPSGTDHDFTDLHAWAEVYAPGAGWIGLDATSGLFCGEGHLPLCATPHYRSAAPISGLVEPAQVEFGFEMKVTRIHEAPRITMPFGDESWAALDRLGQKVDADLAKQDVRLTMGGEPTFVSIDDFEAAEWNTSAVGPTKQIRADDLVKRLRARFAPGGFVHYGQGKWYPGESLPRWAFALYWRRDGKAILNNADLAARATGPREVTHLEAEKLARSLAQRLGLANDYVHPAYEDPAHWLLKEGDLPFNVDALDPKIEDPEERARMVRTFERGLTVPTGFVLPIQRLPAQRWNAPDGPRWSSEVWRLRRGKLFLLPGDSPVGFRLPLSALPFIAPEDYPHVIPQDPLEARSPLPEPDRIRKLYSPDPKTGRPRTYAAKETAATVRTALSIEPRDGVLYVFMPPVSTLED